MTTARATMVTLVIAVVPRRPQCWRPGIPIGTRGTHKYPAGHGGAEGRGYLLGGGKASGAVIWLVMVCHRHGFPGGPLKPFVPTIGKPWHLRPSGCGGNKKISEQKVASEASLRKSCRNKLLWGHRTSLSWLAPGIIALFYYLDKFAAQKSRLSSIMRHQYLLLKIWDKKRR